MEREPLFMARALLTVVVPEELPILRIVAAPPMFRVVALVLSRLKVEAVVVKMLPPLMVMLPAVVSVPERSMVKTVVPEADAARIFWSVPVSFNMARALPVLVPETVNLPMAFVETSEPKSKSYVVWLG